MTDLNIHLQEIVSDQQVNRPAIRFGPVLQYMAHQQQETDHRMEGLSVKTQAFHDRSKTN